MDSNFKDYLGLALNALQALGIVVGAIWAFYRFRIELPWKPRIEFDIDTTFLGSQENGYVASIDFRAANKGTVNHTITKMEIRIRGIKNGAVFTKMGKNQYEKVEFPEKIVSVDNLIPTKYRYYFVRPNINQTFHYYTVIPNDIRFIIVWAAFKYEGSKELHTAEKIFEVKVSK